MWYSNTQNDFSPGAAIFSLHTLASPSGRNVNYDEKQLTGGERGELSCSFYLYRFCKYVSYGFPTINFCNPGVHYETPRMYINTLISDSEQPVYELPSLPNNNAAKHFYTNRSGAKCWLDIYHWGAGLAVTGRIRSTGQIVLQSSFQTGNGSSPQLPPYFVTYRILLRGIY